MAYFKTIALLLLIFCSCGSDLREQQDKKMQDDLSQKQQQLLLWEQQLAQKEMALQEREYRLDSTKKEMDSVVIHRPSIRGRWLVKMQCVETSCSGSAIGDVKTEQWDFNHTDNNILVKAYAGKTLTRVYNGVFTQSGLQLTDNNTGSPSKIEVNLRMLKDGKMDGLREIISQDCKIAYSLTVDKLNP